MHTMTIITGGRVYEATKATLREVLAQIDRDAYQDATEEERLRFLAGECRPSNAWHLRAKAKTGGR